MIYLDYSATTKSKKSVISYFNEVEEKYFANPNSNHALGIKAKEEIDKNINIIKNKLNINDFEIVFTSGASESNNFAIKGLLDKTNKKHIIASKFEHSSINTTLGFLQRKGYKVTFLNTLKNGEIDLDDLKKQITDDTFLVIVAAVNSEIGIREPIEEIGKILKNYNDIVFHSDITQAVGKIKIDLSNVDMASFSGHKIYAPKGIGALIVRKSLKLTPLIHGGKSTTTYRSGTPQTSLICSLGKAIDEIYNNLDENINQVLELNKYIKNKLNKYNNIKINSNNSCIPHILNISILGKKSNEIQKYFSDNDIYISTKTACSSDNELSLAVFNLTKDEERSKSSIRISLSYLTTKEEIDIFIEKLDLYLRRSK
jgi:cysteine desulfurase